jgi:hypothetical protein
VGGKKKRWLGPTKSIELLNLAPPDLHLWQSRRRRSRPHPPPQRAGIAAGDTHNATLASVTRRPPGRGGRPAPRRTARHVPHRLPTPGAASPSSGHRRRPAGKMRALHVFADELLDSQHVAARASFSARAAPAIGCGPHDVIDATAAVSDSSQNNPVVGGDDDDVGVADDAISSCSSASSRPRSAQPRDDASLNLAIQRRFNGPSPGNLRSRPTDSCLLVKRGVGGGLEPPRPCASAPQVTPQVPVARASPVHLLHASSRDGTR